LEQLTVLSTFFRVIRVATISQRSNCHDTPCSIYRFYDYVVNAFNSFGTVTPFASATNYRQRYNVHLILDAGFFSFREPLIPGEGNSLLCLSSTTNSNEGDWTVSCDKTSSLVALSELGASKPAGRDTSSLKPTNSN